MCGIVGAVMTRPVAPVLLEGLQRLEYRGYDSAGIAIISKNKNSLKSIRTVGKIEKLANKLKTTPLTGCLGIAHTRWAHGAPTVGNAHPHIVGPVALVPGLSSRLVRGEPERPLAGRGSGLRHPCAPFRVLPLRRSAQSRSMICAATATASRPASPGTNGGRRVRTLSRKSPSSCRSGSTRATGTSIRVSRAFPDPSLEVVRNRFNSWLA